MYVFLQIILDACEINVDFHLANNLCQQILKTGNEVFGVNNHNTSHSIIQTFECNLIASFNISGKLPFTMK